MRLIIYAWLAVGLTDCGSQKNQNEETATAKKSQNMEEQMEASLYGKWQLKKMADWEGEAPRGMPTLQIDTAKLGASGFGGCNRWSSQITDYKGVVNFESIVSTKMACRGENPENTFFNQLRGRHQWKIADGLLYLRKADFSHMKDWGIEEAQLVFEKTNGEAKQGKENSEDEKTEIAGRWELKKMRDWDGESRMFIPILNLNPSVDSTWGIGFCNDFWANVIKEEGFLDFQTGFATERACQEPKLENQFFQQLRGRHQWKIEDGLLYFRKADFSHKDEWETEEAQLVFEKVEKQEN